MTTIEPGLPTDIATERMVLGSMQLYPECQAGVFEVMVRDDFALDKHRIIFSRMRELFDAGEAIDRVTVAHSLIDHRELEACGGLTYLTELDNDLPQVLNLDVYIKRLQEKAVLRRAAFAFQKFLNRCSQAGENSAEILAEAQDILGQLGESQQVHGKWYRPGDVIREHPGGLNGFLNPERGGSGLKTPWPTLTEWTCGFREGELVVIAGRPSMGKSLIAMQMGYWCAGKEGLPAAVFSLEMDKASLVHRLIAGLARVDAQRLRAGYLSHDERLRAARAAAEVDEIPLWIDDTRARTIAAVSAALRKLKERPRLIIVDHLQLMRASGRAENRYNELSEIVHSLKHLAGEMKATVCLLSQLNRLCEIENRRPQLSDLRDTGSIEEDADIVMFVHRWERYMKFRERPEYKGLGEFLLAKQRNGVIGKLDMVFLGQFQKFEEATSQSEGDYDVQ